MKCPLHPRRDVVGYCAECGRLGCADCIGRLGDRTLCVRCYKKQQDEVYGEREREERKRHKQKLVVRFASGRILKGTSYTLDPSTPGFYLDAIDQPETERSMFIRFEDLKAVFFVKDFEGKFDENLEYSDWAAEGEEVIVTFPDGEVLEGHTLTDYDDRAPRFHVLPNDDSGNNISVLVERANTANVQVGVGAGGLGTKPSVAEPIEYTQAPVGQDEALGDLYFESRNYSAALAEYEKALRQHPRSRRLRRKVLVGNYNMGVHCIKAKSYAEAKKYFELVLKEDPKHEKALKNSLKLKRMLERKREVASETGAG